MRRPTRHATYVDVIDLAERLARALRPGLLDLRDLGVIAKTLDGLSEAERCAWRRAGQMNGDGASVFLGGGGEAAELRDDGAMSGTGGGSGEGGGEQSRGGVD